MLNAPVDIDAGVIIGKFQNYKTKSQLALDIVHHSRSLGLLFAWVGVDGGYGKKPQFLKILDDEGEQFVADVHKDQRVWVWLDDQKPSAGGT